MEFGCLVVFRNGKSSAPYELEEGEHTIGSSMDSNIRLKFSHPLLMQTHALIRVNNNGVATIINKSVGAPVRVNGKVVLRPAILKHEDKFEILEKVFQYFNEYLKNEPEDSEKFVKVKKNILAKSRQSVNPLIKTPARKSPNLKTRVPSIRKSASAVSRPPKGVQVIITPNKKSDNYVGSKTTSKIIVSKALVSPRSAKKRRLSLGNSNKASQSPKISSRNILLSKSTINITISEEHEYSEVASLTSIQENDIHKEVVLETKDRTPRKSVKVEIDETPAKNMSVALIDFNSPSAPAVDSPRRGRRSSVRKTSESNETSSGDVKTPVNKRIHLLKTLRHSHKKDTPPPRFAIPKVTIQPPTPQSGTSDITVTYSPDAEPSTHNFKQKDSKTPRRSTDKSRVSFAVEAPTEDSPIHLEALNESDHLADEGNDIFMSENVTEKDNLQGARKSRSSRSIANEEIGTPDARKVSKSKQSLSAEEFQPGCEKSKSRRSSRYSLNSTKRLEDDNSELPGESLQKTSRRSRSNRWSKTREIFVGDSPDDIQEQKRENVRSISAYTEDSPTEKRNLARTSTLTTKSKISTKCQNGSFISEDEKLAELLVSSDEEMDELQIPEKSNDFSVSENDASNTSKNASTKLGEAATSPTEDEVTDHDSSISKSSRLSRKASRNSKIEALYEGNAADSTDNANKSLKALRKSSGRSSDFKALASSSQSDDEDAEDNVNKSFRVSRAAFTSSKIEALINSSQSENNGTEAEDNVKNSSRVSRASFRRSSKIESLNDSSQSEDNGTEAEDNAKKSSRVSRASFRKSSKIEAVDISSRSENKGTEEEDNVNKSSRIARVSVRSSKIEALIDSSQSEDNGTEAEDNVKKSSRVSRASLRKSSKMEAPTGSSQNEDNGTNADGKANKSSRVSRTSFRRSSKIDALDISSQSEDNARKSFRVSKASFRRSSKNEALAGSSQSEDNDTDEEDNANKSSKVSRASFRRSSKIETLIDSSQSEDNGTEEEDGAKNSSIVSKKEALAGSLQSDDNGTDGEDNANRSSGVSRSFFRRSKIEAVTDSSQSEDNMIDVEDNANKSSRVSRSSFRNSRIEGVTDSSQSEDNAVDVEANANKSSVVSRSSFRSSRIEAVTGSLESEDNVVDVEDNANKSSIVSRSFRRSSKVEALPDSSQNEDIGTDTGDNANKSSRVSRVSFRNSKIGPLAGSSQNKDNVTDTKDNGNKSSRVSGASFRSSKIEPLAGSSQSEYNVSDAEDNVNKSSRVSRTLLRRSSKQAGSSQSEDDITNAEDNASTSKRISRNVSRRDTKIEEGSADSSQTEDNTDVGDNINKPFGSRNSSRRSKNMKQSDNSLLKEDDSADAEQSLSKSSRLYRNISRNVSATAEEIHDQTPDKSLKDVSRRSTRAVKSQSSIDSAETTVNMQQNDEKETKNRSPQGVGLFDESTQDAKTNASASENKSHQRVGIFDESTREVFPELDKSKSVKPISVNDDTEDVLSPVRPLSSRRSLRSIGNQNPEGSISPSTRVSAIRRSRTSMQNSSMTSTSLDQSSGSVVSVPSQSFSSFKRGSFTGEDMQNESEIDVINISSSIDATTDVKESSSASVSHVKTEILEESIVPRTSTRQSRTSGLFKDVTCTSTPFHKQNSSKRSRESDTSDSRNGSQNKRSGSSTVSSSKHEELISISSASDSVFLVSSAEKRSRSGSKVYEETRVPRRSSSRNSGIYKGEHNCVSCRNSSVKRSRSLSATSEPLAVEGRNASSSSRPSKTSRESDVFQQSYEEASPVKRISSAASGTTTTPLLHRKSLATSLSEETPEKLAVIDDETPKSAIKPARLSTKKADQSAYKPLLEDITPVTPEKLAVSGFTEDVFKTPINTPGLFENIRKSVIRSRKRHRESTGSTMKDSKRARVDFAQEEHPETSTDDEYSPQKPQRSPVNRLSNFEGVKKLMRTPPKSPKNDLRNVPNLRNLVSPKVQASPKNDLTNVAGVKKMFNSPKDVKSPKNDLSNVPNLRRLISPKRQNTPKNDLRQIPNLKRIMSPKVQNSPKNDLSSPLGVKQLLKSPREQKEPANDLGNITGVASMFNVSGVEVLHQGSDIENSEDLFTKLTGKPPVRAYPRGKSLTPPNKEEKQAQSQSRKTMGDLPVCSPRVQQWVEDHANVRYGLIEDASEKPPSEEDDILFNVSEQPRRTSRKGHSVSPKKPGADTKKRRKTQGDALADSPKVSAWKGEQAVQIRTRRSSTARNANVKNEILSPNPVQTLQATSSQSEKVTPQPQRLKAERLTPQQQAGTPSNDTITPAGVRPRRGAAKLAVEDRQEPEMDRKESVASAPRQPTATPSNDTITPASVRSRRGAAKLAVEDRQEPEMDRKESVASDDQLQTSVSETPKEVENRPLTVLKRGGRQKKIMSAEELDVVTSTTASPVQESSTKATRTRREAAKTQMSPVVDNQGVDNTETATKTKKAVADSQSDNVPNEMGNEVEASEPKKRTRGRAKKNKVDDIKATPDAGPSPVTRSGLRGRKVEDTPVENEPVNEKEVAVDDVPEGNKMDDIKATPDVSASPVKRGGRRGRKVEDTPVENEPVSEKEVKVSSVPEGRSRRHKIEHIKVTPDVVASPVKRTGRRGRKVEDTPVENDAVNKKEVEEANVPERNKFDDIKATPDVSASPVKRGGRRGRKVEDTSVKNEPVNEKEVMVSSVPEGRSRRNKIEDIKATPDVVASPVKRAGRRGRKVQDTPVDNEAVDEKEVQGSPQEKPTSRSRRGKKIADVQESASVADAQNEAIHKKLVTRGRPIKKEVEETHLENEPEIAQNQVDKKLVSGRRGRKEPENMEDIPGSISEEEVKKPIKGRRGKKEESQESETEVNNADAQNEEPEVKKPTRGRRGKKMVEEESTETSNENLAQQQFKEVDVKKTSRSRRGRKVEENHTVEENESNNVTNARQEVTEETADTDVEFKKPTRSKSKKGETQVSNAEDVASPKKSTRRGALQNKDEAEITPSSPVKKSTRSRGKKQEVDGETENTKRGGKSAKTEEAPEALEPPKKPLTRGRGKKATEEVTEDHAPSQSSRKPRNKIIEEVIEMDVESPRSPRAKRGINKKYSTEEYEVEKKGGSKRKVHFEEDIDADKQTSHVDTRKSKRTRK